MNRISSLKEQLARSMILAGESNRYIGSEVGIDKNTVWTLSKKVRAEVGIIYCVCGKPAGHRGWCGPRVARSPNRIASMTCQWIDVSRINFYIPSRPRYERPHIPNERETDVPLLVNRRNALAIDGLSEFRPWHEIISAQNLDPFELLALKEEVQSREHIERQRDILLFNRFSERQLSAHGTIH